MFTLGSIALGVNPAAVAARTSPPAADDAVVALTAGLAVGDEEAFRALHNAYHDRLHRYLLVVCRGDEDAADDALQQAWLRVVRHARRFTTEDDLWRWLAALARSAAVDGARRRNRYGAALTRYLNWFRQEADVHAEPADDPLDRLEALLESGLEELPTADRNLLMMRYRGGVSVQQLAASAGVSEKAMESRLGRLRAGLRRRLLQRLADENNAS